MNIAALKTKYFNRRGIVALSFFSVFLPFFITAIIIIVIGLCILLSKNARAAVFNEKYYLLGFLFAVYTGITAIFNLNFIGLACSAGFVFMLTVFLYFKNTITHEEYETGLNFAVVGGLITGIITFIDYLIFSPRMPSGKIYRATLYFFNCNYLATVLAIVTVICAYKVIAKKGVPAIYYITAAVSMVAIYLTGSLFAIVEVFVGISALLLLTRRHQMLSVLLLLAATGLIVIYCAPDLVPRLKEANITTENRVEIWKTSIEAIKESPVLGRGFLTYFMVYKNFPGAYPTTHAHNIILEPLLSFGIIGTAIILLFFIFYYKKVVICKNYQSKSMVSSLIIAVTAGALVHATTDMTLIWIQTGFLFLLILSGIGYEERILKI